MVRWTWKWVGAESMPRGTSQVRGIVHHRFLRGDVSVLIYIIPLQPHITFVDIDFIRDALACPLDPVLDEPGWRPAAVLLLICGRVPHVIMTEKPQHMRVHAGEISFPGGKPESVDADLCETALREAREEIGYGADRRSVVGQLGAVHTMNSRFTILPFVAVQERMPPMRANAEVEAILRIPLEPLLKTLAADTRRGKGMFTLQYMGKTIWGASARMLEQVSSRLAGRRADTR